MPVGGQCIRLYISRHAACRHAHARLLIHVHSPWPSSCFILSWYVCSSGNTFSCRQGHCCALQRLHSSKSVNDNMLRPNHGQSALVTQAAAELGQSP